MKHIKQILSVAAAFLAASAVLAIGTTTVLAATAPATPTGLQALSDVGQVEITWTAPSNGGSAITDYLVQYRQVNAQNWTNFSHTASTTAAQTVTGLTNGKSYEFQVAAVNGIGTSSYSSSVYMTPLASLFSDNFESDTNGLIDGQNGWSSSANTGTWNVGAGDGGKVVSQTTPTGEAFFTNLIANSGTLSQNQRVKVDFNEATGTTGIGFSMRRAALTGSTNEYFVSFGSDGSYSTIYSWINGSLNQLAQFVGSANLSTNTWYTAEVTVINDGNNNPVISVYEYPQGGSRPSTPYLTYTDTNHLINTAGYVGVGTFGGSPEEIGFDNFNTFGLNDTTGPSSLITYPAANATVSGTSFSAAATVTDNNAVKNVQFQVDGTNVGTLQTGLSSGPATYSTQFDTTGFINGTHNLTAVATDFFGNQTTSAAQPINVSNTVVVPGAPTGLSANSDTGAVDLAWTAPTSIGGAAISDYSVQERIAGSSSWLTVGHTAFTATNYVVNGLANDTRYDFQVAAINSAGTGAYSNLATTKPLGLQLSDNFESYANGSNLDGQGGWVTNNGVSVWQIASDNGGQVVENANGYPGFQLNGISNTYNAYGDTRVVADFKANTSGAYPMIWLRRAALNGTSNGYFVFLSSSSTISIAHYDTISGSYTTLGTGTSPITLTNGTYYTIDASVINDDNGIPNFAVYIYAAGSQRPVVPAAVATDPSALYASGYAGFATGGTPTGNANGYDNFKIYGLTPAAATQFTVAGNANDIAGHTITYTVQPNGVYTGTFTPSDGGAGGTFSPTTIAFSGTSLPKTFTYTNATAGGYTITGTGSPTLSATNGVDLKLFASATASSTVSDSKVYWSPYNWRFNGSTYAQTDNGGAYLKVAFTGSTLGLLVDTSQNQGAYLNQMVFDAYIDGSPTPITKNLMQLEDGMVVFSHSLSAGSHYAVIYVAQLSSSEAMYQSNGTYGGPDDLIRITGIRLADDSSTTPVAASAIAPKEYKVIMYGDSITAGYGTTGDEFGYAGILGNDLGVEYGQTGFPGQGWNLSGNGGVPQFYDSTTPSLSTFRNYDANDSRLVTAGNLSSGYIGGAPNAVFNNMGINDADTSQPTSTVRSKVTAWLTDERQVVGAGVPIFIIMPYNLGNTGNGSFPAYVTAINGGVSDYQAANPSDQNVHVLNLGATGYNEVQANSADGLHPNNLAAKQIGDALAGLSSTIIFTVPGQPTSVTATAGDTTATVTFVAPTIDGGTPITGYTVLSTPTGGVDSNAGSTALTHMITGLTDGTPYTFTVVATNSIGSSASSTASAAVTPAVPVVSGGGTISVGFSGGGGPPTGIPASGTGSTVSPANPINPNIPATAGTSLINDKGTYYLASDSVRYGITNPGILTSYGYAFNQATIATAAQLALPVVSNVPPNNGALVKTVADPTVYLISGSMRYGFTSARVFAALGYKFSSVVVVTTPELNLLPVTTPLNTIGAHMPGTNIVLNGTVYWIGVDDMLHAYPSLAIYNSWNIAGDFSRTVIANAQDKMLQIGAVMTART